MAENTNNHLRLVVTPSSSGTTAQWLCQVYSVAWGWDDSQQINWSDAVVGSYAYTASAPSNSSQLLASTTVTKAGVRGGSYNLDVSVSGAYDGSAPSLANVNVTIPIIAPSAPGTPSASSISTSGCVSSWTAPTDWGGNNTGNYNVQIDDNSGFTSPTTSAVTSATKTFSGLLPNTTYYIRAQGTNSAGAGVWSATRSFTTSIGLPSAPGTPSATSITTAGFSSAWTAPSDWGGDNTGNYDVQIADNPSFTGATNHAVTSAARVFSGLSPNTTHYVRARGTNGAGGGTWSATRTVTTAIGTPSSPGTPVVSSILGVSATATWTDPSNWGGDDSSDFKLQIATNSGFSGATEYTITNANTKALTGLTKGTLYYLRARGTNGGGDGSWSTTQTFTTLTDPSVPTSLAASLITGITASIGWGAPANNGGSAVTGYDVQVATAADFLSGVLVNLVAHVGNSYAVTGLTPATTYYWRARSKTVVGNSAWASSSFASLSSGFVQTGAGVVKPVISSWVQTAPGVTKKVVGVFVKTGATTWKQ